jgi:sugar/nucleoside kinase (ribokinase family)
MRKWDAMVAGHLCLDITPGFHDTGIRDLSRILAPGKLIHAESPEFSTGGAVSNTGLAMKKLGLNVCFSALVGEDEFGDLTVRLLEKNGGAEGIRRHPGIASSYSIVISFPGIDRCFLHCPGTNDAFTAADVDSELLGQCRLFHFGYPQLMKRVFENDGTEFVKIFKKAKDAGVVTSCDMALPDPESPAGKAPWRRILEAALPYIDIFVPSIEEAMYAVDPEFFMETKRNHPDQGMIDILSDCQYRELGDQLVRWGASIVALKSGKHGWHLRTASETRLRESSLGNCLGDIEKWGNREIWSPAFDAERIFSTTGAGDCSIAGFLAAILRGFDPEKALKTASCLGWQNLRARDALSGIGTWSETLQLLDRIPACPLKYGAQWRRDSKGFLAFGPDDSKEKKANNISSV